MPGKVKLEIIEGPMLGKQFVFGEHDTFLFGRMPECGVCLPYDDMVSRHHFIIEVNPPDARIRDLGSLNGTYVNGAKYGSRRKGETPEEGAKRMYPEVDLKDEDKIEVGQTVLKVSIEVPAVCCDCGKTIPGKDRERCAWIGNTFICADCKQRLLVSVEPSEASTPVRCQECGKDVSAEIGNVRVGDYICNSCRRKIEADPKEILIQLLRPNGERYGEDSEPEISEYEIERRLGVGGCGAVYLARRKRDNEHVAVKVMLSKVAVDELARDGFLREIDQLENLHHEKIVSLLGKGSTGSCFYFVMEYCEGGSVEDLMEYHKSSLELSMANHIILQALEGLMYAHKKGFVHRDLKPGNILLKDLKHQLTAKISDLGLAKNFQQAGFSGMTITGSYAGTPYFMPREQVTNFKYVKPVSDLWSIGATFYYMLTRQFPREFRRGEDPIEVILQGGIVPIRKRDSSIPKKIAKVIDRALADKPNDRYQTAFEMLKALKKSL